MKKYLLAMTLVMATSTAFADFFQLSEEESATGAADGCEALLEENPGGRCQVRGRSLSFEWPGLVIPEEISLNETDVQEACNAMYSKMRGIHFAEGWRFNLKDARGRMLASCPMDSY